MERIDDDLLDDEAPFYTWVEDFLAEHTEAMITWPCVRHYCRYTRRYARTTPADKIVEFLMEHAHSCYAWSHHGTAAAVRNADRSITYHVIDMLGSSACSRRVILSGRSRVAVELVAIEERCQNERCAKYWPEPTPAT